VRLLDLFAGSPEVDDVTKVIGDQQLLVVLDNVEHLVDLAEVDRWCFLRLGSLPAHLELCVAERAWRSTPWRAVDARAVLTRLVDKVVAGRSARSGRTELPHGPARAPVRRRAGRRRADDRGDIALTRPRPASPHVLVLHTVAQVLWNS